MQMIPGLSCVRLITGGSGGIVINDTLPLVQQEFFDPTGALERESVDAFCGIAIRGNEKQGWMVYGQWVVVRA